MTLVLCHTVTITGKTKKLSKPRESATFINPAFNAQQGEYDYQASSPDEKALAEACQRFYKFII